MIKVYEVIRDCSITYTSDGMVDKQFVIYKGDFFFIDKDCCWVKNEGNRFNGDPLFFKKSKLLKIYYNRFVGFDDDGQNKYEWTWENDINIIDPVINDNIHVEDFDKISPLYGQPYCKDVTLQWEREEKLNKITT